MSALDGGGSKKKKDKNKLPEPLETQRKYVICGADVNAHVSMERKLTGSSRAAGTSWPLH